MLEVIVLCVCPILFAVGAISDLVRYRIPNWVSLSLVAAFALAFVLSGQPLAVAGAHLLAGLVALAATVGLFAIGAFGGGDIKFFSAGALWAGPLALADFAFWMAIAGGVLAVSLLVIRRTPLSTLSTDSPSGHHVLKPRTGMPYGVAIAVGAMIALPKTPLFQMVLA